MPKNAALCLDAGRNGQWYYISMVFCNHEWIKKKGYDFDAKKV